jgi:hypothetical protein
MKGNGSAFSECRRSVPLCFFEVGRRRGRRRTGVSAISWLVGLFIGHGPRRSKAGRFAYTPSNAETPIRQPVIAGGARDRKAGASTCYFGDRVLARYLRLAFQRNAAPTTNMKSERNWPLVKGPVNGASGSRKYSPMMRMRG